MEIYDEYERLNDELENMIEEQQQLDYQNCIKSVDRLPISQEEKNSLKKQIDILYSWRI